MYKTVHKVLQIILKQVNFHVALPLGINVFLVYATMNYVLISMVLRFLCHPTSLH
jgi:hypothetical protein